MAERENALLRLQRLAKIKQRRQTELDAAERALYDAVLACDALGVPRATIASSAGLSRQTVYSVLRRAQ